MKFKSHQVSFVPGSNLQLPVELSRENRRILRLDLALALALLAGAGIGGILLAGQAAAAPEVCKIDLRVDRVYREPLTQRPAAIVTASHGCRPGFASVHVTCTWLHQGKPIGVSMQLLENVQAGVPATERFEDIFGKSKPFESARCRVTKTRRYRSR